MSIHDKFSHIDQLAEWWENAEESNDFYPGDTWIKRRQAQTGGYVYDVGRVTGKKWYFEARVLSRAPKPKPAWHDAVAVIATFRDGYGMVTGVWAPEGSPGYWENPGGDVVDAAVLENVTPLIEAKVTDEMVERGRDIGVRGKKPEPELVRRILTAALGIEEGS